MQAQQNPIIYRFDLYENFYNPSLDAFDGKMGLQTIFKSQMTGVKGAPLQMGVGFSLPLSKIFGRVGLETFGEKIGFFSKTTARISYASDVKVTKTLTLSGGVSFNINSLHLNKNDWVLPQKEVNDPLIQRAIGSTINPNFSTFISIRSQNYKIGTAVIDIIPSASKVGIGGISRAYNFIGAYTIKISPAFKLNQSVFYLGNGSDSDIYAFILGVKYKKFISASASTISLKNLALSTDYKIGESILLGYTFDMGFERKDFFFLSHEIYLRYYFTFAQKSDSISKYKNIRFL